MSSLRLTIERWMLDSRSSSRWRSASDSSSVSFSRAWLVAQLAQRALGLDHAKQAHGERQRPRHAAGEVALLRGEDGLVVAGEHERAQALVVDRASKAPGTRRRRGPEGGPSRRCRRARSPRAAPARVRTRSPRRTPSAPTIAPASASNASAARSTASPIAAGSSSAAEIAARNSVSCWAAQLVGTPSATSFTSSRARRRIRSCGIATDPTWDFAALMQRPLGGEALAQACLERPARVRSQAGPAGACRSRSRRCRRTRGQCPRRCRRCPGGPRARRRRTAPGTRRRRSCSPCASPPRW